jgi:hypothetical protein
MLNAQRSTLDAQRSMLNAQCSTLDALISQFTTSKYTRTCYNQFAGWVERFFRQPVILKSAENSI